MQSRVLGLVVTLSHSMSICASSSPTGAGLRFLGFAGAPVLVVGDVGSSVALRLLLGLPGTGLCATGLAARLPLATGLVARLPDPPARGLLAREPLRLPLGALGLVARLATTE